MPNAVIFTSPTVLELKNQQDRDTYNQHEISTGDKYVRRPLMGLNPKPDTYASITISTPEGSPDVIVNSSKPGSNKTHYTTNFLLQSISESRQEKAQPVPTFGDTFYYFFGEQPTQVQVTAILLNSANFEWEVEWWLNYAQALRGTKLVDQNARATLTFENVEVTGYITTCSVQKNANTPMESTLSFSMFVDYRKLKTADGRFPGNNSFKVTKSLLQSISDLDNAPIATSTLNTKALRETLDFIDEGNNIGRQARVNAILGDSWGSKVNAFGSGAKGLLTKGSEAELIISSKEFDLSGSIANSFTSVAKSIATNRTEFEYAELLSEYVSRPTDHISEKRATEAKSRYETLLTNIKTNKDAALAAINYSLLRDGFTLEEEPPYQGTEVYTPPSARDAYEERLAERTASIEASFKTGALFTASVVTLAAARGTRNHLAQNGKAGQALAFAVADDIADSLGVGVYL